MIRTIPTFRMPTPLLVGALLTLAALAGLPTDAWAEFRIGVWQPGGHVRADTSFTSATVADLDALGVDLLINTPNEAGDDATLTFQAFEESIMSQWSGTGPNGPRGFVVQHAPEGHSRRGYPWKLECYAGSLCDTMRSPALHNPMWLDERNDLGETVDSLVNKWSAYDGFYGYRIGHEADYCGGIYDSATYANMATVIDSIRADDTTRRIVAIGNTQSRVWDKGEQTAFRQSFFRPATEPGPANIFMQERYILGASETTEELVQGDFDLLSTALDTIGTMVDSARIEGRKAEWHCIVQVAYQNAGRTQTRPNTTLGFHRHPTLPELKAQVNMALWCGATGVIYFVYTSSNGYVWNYEYDGLVDLDRNRRQPIWNAVRTVNDTLRTLGDALNPLTWDAGFPSDRLSNSTLVDAVRLSANHAAGRLEFGVFHDDAADYVLAVNRDSLRTGGSQTIDLRFDTRQMQSDRPENGRYVVREIVTGVEGNYTADASNHIWITQQTLAPGDARLYRILGTVGRPRNLEVDTPTSSSVLVEWDAPANATGLAGYRVEWRADGATSWNSQDIQAATTQYTIPHLSSATTYNWRVSSRATTNYAPSNPVDGADFTTATTPPPATFSFVPPRSMESATVGLQYSFNRPNATGGTGTVTYATTSTGSGLTAARTGISGQPTTAGSFDFTWTATDGARATATFTLTLTVRSQNSAPSFDDASVSYSAQAGSTVNETLPEAEGASSYETSGTVPGYVTVNTTTRAISIQPENTHVGDDSFTWRARNTHGTDDLTVNITVTALPTVSAPGPVRNLSASGGSVSGSIAVSWDAPNTGGTPTLYRVEYRQGSAAWQAGGTTTQTSLSIGNLVGGGNYSIQVRAENRGGNSSWQSTTATATNGTQTQYAYRLNNSSSNPPTFTASASTFYIYSVEDMRTNNSEICSDFLDLLLGTDVTHGYGMLFTPEGETACPYLGAYA